MLDTKVLTFLKVCELMNYTAAAEELHLTQPAVSRHIHALEEYYQVKLFDYHNKKLSLTEEGVFLKKTLSVMNHDTLRIQDDIRHIGKRRRLRLGATLSIGNYALVERLITMIRSHDNMDVSLTVADTADLLERLDGGGLDFILCEGNFRKEAYAYHIIREVPLAVFCSAGYDTSQIYELKDLFAGTIILREEGSGTREIFEHFLAERGYSNRNFRNYHEINNPEVILKLLAAGIGISVLYENVGEEMVQAGVLKKIKLKDFSLTHEFNAIWKKDSLYEEDYRRYIRELLQM